MAQTSRKDLLVVFSLWLMVFAASSQVMIVAPILPRIGAALSIQEELQGNFYPHAQRCSIDVNLRFHW